MFQISRRESSQTADMRLGYRRTCESARRKRRYDATPWNCALTSLGKHVRQPERLLRPARRRPYAGPARL